MKICCMKKMEMQHSQWLTGQKRDSGGKKAQKQGNGQLDFYTIFTILPFKRTGAQSTMWITLNLRT